MKVLFDHPQPFLLAHGGLQTQIEQTKQALEQIGVKVEHVRWWDAGQSGELIHYFGLAPGNYLRLAEQKKLPVVMTPLLSATCNRPNWKLTLQSAVIQAALRLPLFEGTKAQLGWPSYKISAHLTVGLEAEKDVLRRVFGVEPSRVSVIPLGISEAYIAAASSARDRDYLMTTGTIYQVKGTIPLARLGRATKVPILFVGKPYDPRGPYWMEFQSLIDNEFVRYHSHVESEAGMIALLQHARGFVLNSQFENWSLAASEAIACGLPILVPDQKWSRERFGNAAWYFGKPGSRENAQILRQFYDECLRLPAAQVKLFRWRDVALRLRDIYVDLLRTSQ